MKTRIIHTKFWTDSYIRKLKKEEKLFYFYLISNELINIIAIYELPIDIAAYHTGIPIEQLENIKNKFKADGKIDFIDEWIYLINAEKYSFYRGIKNNHLKLRLLIEMSAATFDYFKQRVEIIIKTIIDETDLSKVNDVEYLSLLTRVINRGIDKGMGILPIKQKPEYINPNTETRKESDITNKQGEENYDPLEIGESFEKNMKLKEN